MYWELASISQFPVLTCWIMTTLSGGWRQQSSFPFENYQERNQSQCSTIFRDFPFLIPFCYEPTVIYLVGVLEIRYLWNWTSSWRPNFCLTITVYFTLYINSPPLSVRVCVFLYVCVCVCVCVCVRVRAYVRVCVRVWLHQRVYL